MMTGFDKVKVRRADAELASKILDEFARDAVRASKANASAGSGPNNSAVEEKLLGRER